MFYSVRVVVDEKSAEIIHMLEQRSGAANHLVEKPSQTTWHVMEMEGIIEAENMDDAVRKAQLQALTVIEQAAQRIETYKKNTLKGLTVADFVGARNFR